MNKSEKKKSISNIKEKTREKNTNVFLEAHSSKIGSQPNDPPLGRTIFPYKNEWRRKRKNSVNINTII